ncbi:MAG: RNase J family beta-CASP ribonuclease [Methanomicrobiales archaeon]|nr:RNase J family beta-CASP ribonuclease [Methanomicrobiales archaeon]
MDIEILAVGGYNEFGRNMTAVRCGKEIVIFDMGIRLDSLMMYPDIEMENTHSLDLIQMGVIPDDTAMNQLEGTVKAVILSHGHLDHIGAVPKLVHRYNAPIIGTPYTIELVKQQIESEKKFGVSNKLIALKFGQRYNISNTLSMELVRTQHSIIDTATPVLYTPKGAIVYALDFKLDRNPVLGEPPDFAKFQKIGKEGVLCLITESTNVNRKGRCPSEQIAKNMVRDVMTSYEDDKNAIIVSTFASHIARVKTIAECANEIGRKPLLLGRSMERFCVTAEQMKMVRFPDTTSVFGNRRVVERTLRRLIKTGKEQYVPIVTGHQGEPGSILTRIAQNDTPYKIEKGDKVMISAQLIPNDMNRAQRYRMFTMLKRQGARLFDELHVSGHAFCEDHYEFVHLLNPQYIVSAHGGIDLTSEYLGLATEMGYTLNKDFFLMANGQRQKLA